MNVLSFIDNELDHIQYGETPPSELSLSTQNDISVLTGPASADSRAGNRYRMNPSEYFLQVPLSGRVAETLLLQQAYNRILEPNAPGEVVLVCGAPGAGKTRLINSSLRDYIVQENLKGLFASGKFERVQQDGLPYSAMVSCFTDLVDLSLQDKNVAQIRTAVTEALGSEPLVLQRLISNLQFLIATEEENAYGYDYERSAQDSVLDGQAMGQFTVLCKSFLRAVAAPDHPVVIFFDDTQWADANSRALLDAIITDTEWKNVLIIVAFREEIAFAGQTDTRSTGDLRKHFEATCQLPLSKVEVAFLSIDGINELLSKLFCLEEETTLALSETIKRKTYGNPYHIIQFLSMIESRGWLRLFAARGSWEWDAQEIRMCAFEADNVMSAVSHHFERLDASIRECLFVASFIGYSFDFDLLLYVMQDDGIGVAAGKEHGNGEHRTAMTKDKLTALLDTAVSEALLQRASMTYTFSHDAIHEYLYKPTQGSIEAEKFHLSIGRRLWMQLKEVPTSHNVLLMTVEHMNKARHSLLANKEERIALAELNFRAGKAAAARSAYYSDYYQKAMLLLDPEERWTVHYDLCLDLFSTAVEHDFMTGRLERCITTVHEVISNARNAQHKLRVYDAWINVLCLEGKLKEASRLASKVLRALNESFPRNATAAHAVYEVLRVFKRVKSVSDEELCSLPVMEDENKLAAAKIMWTLTSYAFFYQAKWLLTCLSFRLAYLSIQDGISSTTPYSFAMLACSAAQLQNYKKAARFGRIASRVMQRTGIASQPSTLLFQHTTVNHWYRPLEESIVALTRAYEIGARFGDHVFSLLSGGSSIVLSFYCGRPLLELEEDMRMLMVKMKEMKLEPLISVSRPFQDIFQSLTGLCSDPFGMLRGGNGYQAATGGSTMQNRMHANTLAFVKLMLCVYMENWDRCPNLFLELRKYEQETAAIVSNWIGTFFSGIAAFQLVKISSTRRFRVLSRKIMKKMALWVDSGVVNCNPLLTFLKAEEKCATGQASTLEIRAAYDQAIDACANHPFPQYEALANDRAAEALMAVGDDEHACIYARRAHTLYERWEARAKVRQLSLKYALFITR